MKKVFPTFNSEFCLLHFFKLVFVFHCVYSFRIIHFIFQEICDLLFKRYANYSFSNPWLIAKDKKQKKEPHEIRNLISIGKIRWCIMGFTSNRFYCFRRKRHKIESNIYKRWPITLLVYIRIFQRKMKILSRQSNKLVCWKFNPKRLFVIMG